MVARFPLRTLLRDVVMMLCGSILGLLLAQGFSRHDLRVMDVSHLCGAVQVSKKEVRVAERSEVKDRPFFPLGGEEGGRGSRSEGVGMKEVGEPQRGGWGLEVESQGSGGKANYYIALALLWLALALALSPMAIAMA